MKRTLPPAFLTLIIGIALAGSASATTYYIAANGSDANSGTSESTPWAHLPGMATWTGSHTPTAGDVFILRGCDVWGNSSLPITWTWSGTSGSPITIDRDVTWYNSTNCTSGWNRAVLDAQGEVIPSGANQCAGSHHFLQVNSAQYVTFKWIEARRFFWNIDANNSCWNAAGHIISSGSDYLTVDSWYIHDWTHATTAGTTDQGINVIQQENSTPACQHCVIQNSVIDNTDGDGADCSSTHTMCSGGGVEEWSAKNNIWKGTVEAWYGPTWGPATIEIGGNNISHLNMSFTNPTQSGPVHPNCIEPTGTVTGTVTLMVHDNWIHNISVCEGAQLGNGNETDYVWNNIWDMGATATAGANGPQVPQSSSSTWSFYFWNNTVRWASGCVNNAGHGGAAKNFYLQNNHCINDGSIVTGGGWSPSGGTAIDHNVAMTNATATSQGYTTSENYVFSPTASTNSTVGAGISVASLWPAGFPTNDTTLACLEQTVGGVVESVCPTRSDTTARTSTWDAGAYLWVNSSAPTPPTGLTASVQ